MVDNKTSPNEGDLYHIPPTLKAFLFILTGILFAVGFYLSAIQEKTDIQFTAYLIVFRSLFITLFIFFTAFAIGSRETETLTRTLFKDRSCHFNSQWQFRYRTRCFLSFSLGLGTLGFIILGLGAMNLLRREIVGGVFIIIFLSGFRYCARFMGRLRVFLSGFARDEEFSFFTIFLIVILVFIVILYLICALPQPIQYDVLEYHLGSLSQSLTSGSIAPQPGVFYSYLPFGVESIHAAGVLFEGKEICLTPKLLNFGFWLLCLLGVYVFFELAGMDRDFRLLGLILFGLNPLGFSVALDAFVEPGQTVYVLSALCCWALSWKSKNEAFLIASFVFWGLALGVKLSILGLGVIPFMIILLPVGLRIMNSDSGAFGKANLLKSWFRYIFLGGAIIGIIYLPWMIRSLYHTGNPFFPFFSRLFRWEGWTPEQMRYYIQSNRDVLPFSIGNLRLQLTKWNDMGALIFLPLFLTPLLYKRNLGVSGLAAFALTGYFFLNAIIQTPSRFIVPLIPVFILLTLLVLKRLIALSRFGALFLAPYLILILSAYQMHFVELHNTGYLKAALFSFQQDDFLLDHLGYYKEAADLINKRLPENASFLFLYEARSFYIEREVLTNTVFDKSPLVDIAAGENDAKGIRSRLLERGITHVLVNEIELNRLIRTYAPREKIGYGEGADGSIQDMLLTQIQNPNSNLTAFEDLYGPYHFDPHFAENREKIREFKSLLQGGIIFERIDDRGLRFYISRIDTR